jgi:thiamine monophosphate kinase
LTRRSTWRGAMTDGEDFELLFTVRADKAAAFEKAWKRKWRLRLTAIGSVTDRAPGLRFADGARISRALQGYGHFRRA